MEKFSAPEKKFSSPNEEINYLRQQLEQLEQRTDVALPTVEIVSAYKQKEPLEVLTEDFALKTPEVNAIVLDLAPETHDRQIEELLGIVQSKGVRNALSVVAEANNPHLEDDFHRFLIQYLKQSSVTNDLPKGDLSESLKMTLFEVVMPESEQGEDNANSAKVKNILSIMEQFYAALSTVHFSVELAVDASGQEIIFYISVPQNKYPMLEKQLAAFFPGAKLIEQKNDYNIFNADGISVGSAGTLATYPALPIKTFDQFEFDPLNVLINSFAKLQQEGEGAAIQIVFNPAAGDYTKVYKAKLDRLNKGEESQKVLAEENLGKELLKGIGSFFFAPKSEENKNEVKTPEIDRVLINNLEQKLAAPIGEVNIRLVASGSSRPAAEAILDDLESAFEQFAAPMGNKLSFTRLAGRRLAQFFHYFSFRLFDKNYLLPLNLKELTTLFHFPAATVQTTNRLNQVHAKTSTPPLDLPASGLKLGVNRHQGAETLIYFAEEDRLRHFYTVGQTGTGKSTLLKNMVIQDIEKGEGVCFIDPHGVDILDILSAVPEHRFNDVIYFEPGAEYPIGLNMLEYDPRFPDQKTFVVNELLAIFNKLFDMRTVGGPIFEQYFRNSALLALEDPNDNATLLDISRILSDANYRRAKLAKCNNQIIKQFWTEVAEKAGGEAALQNVVPYITSKFDAFLTNDIMRPILLQPKSAFNFREIMDGRKILLVNLAKGRLGDINANLIGLILVGKMLQAALSRVDAAKDSLPAFYLYIDEFQNITTDSTASILSEARKYKLSLHLAHQFIAQIDEKIRDAVFGNVGTIAAFRVGVGDAEYLEQQFTPVFMKNDLINLDNRHAYLKLLVNGRPVKPFDLETLAPAKGTPETIQKLRELSQKTFGRPRAEVEAEIAQSYR